MLTPEATETPIPLTGEVRPKIGPTAQTGTRAASDDAGRAGLAQRLRKGTRQCGHIRHSADPEGRTGRPSGECQIKQEVGKVVGDSKMVRQGVVLETKGKIDIAIADVKDALKS